MVVSTDAYWPVILTYASGEMSDADGDEWIEFDQRCSKRAVEEATGFVSIVGTGHRISVSAGERRRISTYLNERPTADAKYRMSVHMVIRSTVTRGIVKALSWMSTNKSVDKISAHDSIQSAVAGARKDMPNADIDWAGISAWFEQHQE